MGSLTAGYLDPPASRADGDAAGTGATVNQEGPSGEEVLEIVRSEFSAPIGIDAVAGFEELRNDSFEEVVVAGKRWVGDHLAYYDEEAEENYRAYLDDFFNSEGGLRTWYENYDEPSFNPWLEFIIPVMGEENYAYTVASQYAFEPGSDEFKYTFGGVRGYDSEENVLTLQGTEFEGFDPSDYIVQFESEDTEETGATLVRFGLQVRKAFFQFFEAANAGEISEEQITRFNEIVVIGSGCDLFVNSDSPAYVPLERHRKMLNNLNRLAVTLAEWGFEPSDGFRPA
jgi:hypothetical protein